VRSNNIYLTFLSVRRTLATLKAGDCSSLRAAAILINRETDPLSSSSPPSVHSTPYIYPESFFSLLSFPSSLFLPFRESRESGESILCKYLLVFIRAVYAPRDTPRRSFNVYFLMIVKSALATRESLLLLLLPFFSVRVFFSSCPFFPARVLPTASAVLSPLSPSPVSILCAP